MDKSQILEHYLPRIERLEPKVQANLEKGDFKHGQTYQAKYTLLTERGICLQACEEFQESIVLFSESIDTFKEMLSVYLGNPEIIKPGYFSHSATEPFEIAYLLDDIESIQWLNTNWPSSELGEGSPWYGAYFRILINLFLGSTEVFADDIRIMNETMFSEVKAQSELLQAICDNKNVLEKWIAYMRDLDQYIEREWEGGLQNLLSLEGAALLKLTGRYISVPEEYIGPNYRFNK